MNRRAFAPGKTAKACSQHFTDDGFESSSVYKSKLLGIKTPRLLNKSAIPTIRLKGEGSPKKDAIGLSNNGLYKIIKQFVVPAIKTFWLHEISSHFENKSEIRIAGDGQFDSPGYCAKYVTCTTMDIDNGRIADFVVLQKGQVANIKQTKNYCHTRRLESFHSVALKFKPKINHFTRVGVNTYKSKRHDWRYEILSIVRQAVRDNHRSNTSIVRQAVRGNHRSNTSVVREAVRDNHKSNTSVVREAVRDNHRSNTSIVREAVRDNHRSNTSIVREAVRDNHRSNTSIVRQAVRETIDGSSTGNHRRNTSIVTEAVRDNHRSNTSIVREAVRDNHRSNRSVVRQAVRGNHRSKTSVVREAVRDNHRSNTSVVRETVRGNHRSNTSIVREAVRDNHRSNTSIVREAVRETID
ncbi:hypothetical protein PR048_024163, partial [Dryococelus australis]